MNLAADVIGGIANGLREVWSNKVRSLLSMSGIILGVAALVAMVGLVQGMVGNVRASFEGRGGVLRLDINDQELPEEQRHLAGLSPGRTLRDAEAISQNVFLASHVGAEVNLRWQRFEVDGQVSWAGLLGVIPDNIVFDQRELMDGRFISDLDVDHSQPVIVIGSWLREQLFPNRGSVIGEKIRIREGIYTIVGEFADLQASVGGVPHGSGLNRSNYIPATTAIKRFRDNDQVDRLTVMAVSASVIPDVISQVENTLLLTHRGVRDFIVETQEESMAELQRLERSFTFSLGGIAAISLLVGGIGIMNVMLASVSERIREIGVRKAIGARSHDIFLQFLAEAVAISILGGLIGLVVSVGLLAGLREIIPGGGSISGMPIVPMLYGFLFSTLVGLVSGIYPALRAARLDPIDALRYE
jgi:putative ABC transport system permease protein